MTDQKTIGPKVTVHRSCFDCAVCKCERYAVQGDSGFTVSCTHESLSEPRRIGDTNWTTPEWCPVLLPSETMTDQKRDVWWHCSKCGEHYEASYRVNLDDEMRCQCGGTLRAMTLKDAAKFEQSIALGTRQPSRAWQ